MCCIYFARSKITRIVNLVLWHCLARPGKSTGWARPMLVTVVASAAASCSSGPTTGSPTVVLADNSAQPHSAVHCCVVIHCSCSLRGRPKRRVAGWGARQNVLRLLLSLHAILIDAEAQPGALRAWPEHLTGSTKLLQHCRPCQRASWQLQSSAKVSADAVELLLLVSIRLKVLQRVLPGCAWRPFDRQGGSSKSLATTVAPCFSAWVTDNRQREERGNWRKRSYGFWGLLLGLVRDSSGLSHQREPEGEGGRYDELKETHELCTLKLPPHTLLISRILINLLYFLFN